MNRFKRFAAAIAVASLLASAGCSQSPSLKSRIDSALQIQGIEHSKKESYALIINGDPSQVHLKNVSLAYSSLVKLGFEKSKIIVLSEKKPENYTSKESVSADATLDNLVAAADSLSEAVDYNDTVVFYLTGHGFSNAGYSILQLYGDSEIYSADFRELVEKIGVGRSIIISDQCYSGGFAEEFANFPGDAIAVSSVDARHETSCSTFSIPFWNSFSESYADLNKDGAVSVEESFLTASKEHREALSSNEDLASCEYVTSHIDDAFIGKP